MKNLLLPFLFLSGFYVLAQSEPELKLNKLSVEEAYVTLGGLEVTSNRLPISKKAYMLFNGVEGFRAKDEIVYIGCEMKIYGDEGAVLEYEDLFAAYDDTGFTIEESKALSVSLLMGTPLLEHQSYTWWVRFWDKNGPGTIEASYIFHMTPPLNMVEDLGMKTSFDGLSSKQIFFSRDHDLIFFPSFKMGDEFEINVFEIEGLAVRNERSLIGASMTLQDKQGKRYVDYEDLFFNLSPRGEPKADLQSINLSLFLGDPIEPNKDYDLIITIWDKFGRGSLTLQCEISVKGDPQSSPLILNDQVPDPTIPAVANENRVALIIGIKSYESVPPLANTLNDAMDMAAVLKKKGFKVIEVYDPRTKYQIRDAVIAFNKELFHKENSVGLVYYSGHGMQVDGINYIIPAGANMQIKADIEEQCMNMDYVLRAMEEAGNQLNIMILDACRNNPFRSFSRSAEQGLSMVAAPKGSYIVYATKPGSVASDGTGRNGLFTSKLLKYISSPGLKIEEVFKNVALEVGQESNDAQRPWISSDYTGDFYFSPDH